MKVFLIVMVALLGLAAGPINLNSSADDVLDALDARGKDLTSLIADVKMSDIDPTIGEVGDIRTGHLYYQVLPKGDVRWHAVFDQKITGTRSIPQKHEWSYADGKLIERDYRNQTQHTQQILKPGEKMQLFNLEGPFPLPLGQDKADVHKHFDVKKLPPASDDPAGTIHLQLTPIAGTDLARKFKTIDLWVDPKIDMPIRISVLNADGNSQKQTDLSNVRVNVPVQDSDFQMENVNLDKWNRSDD